MFRNLLSIVAVIALALPACAQELNGSPLKVDLSDVVEQGIAAPVDGITSAGQPDEAALQVFADSGYVAVIDLRTERENRGFQQAAVVEALGMEYVSLPVSGSEGINFENATALAELIAKYDEPVLVHCGSANRVGALLALDKARQGADSEEAIEYGKKAGMTRLEGRVREVLEDTRK